MLIYLERISIFSTYQHRWGLLTWHYQICGCLDHSYFLFLVFRPARIQIEQPPSYPACSLPRWQGGGVYFLHLPVLPFPLHSPEFLPLSYQSDLCPFFNLMNRPHNLIYFLAFSRFVVLVFGPSPRLEAFLDGNSARPSLLSAACCIRSSRSCLTFFARTKYCRSVEIFVVRRLCFPPSY